MSWPSALTFPRGGLASLQAGEVERSTSSSSAVARPLPGKEFCTVLDQAGNVLKHGFMTDDGPWSLDIPEEKNETGDAPVKQCDPDDNDAEQSSMLRSWSP